MKKLMTMALGVAMLLPASAHKKQTAAHGYPINPVPFTAVKVTPGTFWGQRLEASRKVTIPLAFSKCEETGRYKNFTNAAEHLKDPSKVFKVNGVGYSFDDTDPYKTIEGASYILQTYPDKQLKQYIDSVLDIIASAQEPDGYLYTARTQNPADPHHWAGDKRWSKEEDLSHELYNLGHMVEGAIAHYQATGSRKFLDIAIRYADVVCKEVGPNPGQACVVPGHQIAEMALAKLYLVTGNKKYLDEAKFFLDYRGKTTIVHDYSQAHKPVIEQDEAVGHAVRAAYMYAGMADVAALTGDQDYIKAIDAIWDNIVSKKLYITGGIGATNNGEAFGKNYELPNMSAYCETCAAIGNVYVNYRLFLLHGESKYYDVLERTLYNGLISGVSLEGNGFFYPNPLESMGQHQRQAWFGCACCPSNICRFIPSLPGYIYAVKDRNVYVNLFLSNKSNLNVAGKKVALSQTTEYPWNGDITVSIDQNVAGAFAMKIRIPGWVHGQVVPSNLYQYTDGKRLGYSIKVNGQQVAASITADGYYTINRKWKKGDKVQIHFDMEPRTVRANNKVEADRGRISIERGPLVYCAEHPDNSFDIMGALMNQNPQFALGKTQIGGTTVQTIVTDAQTLNFDQQGKLQATDQKLTLIPYYAWCHRGSGKMRVWLPQDLNATTPSQPATLASESKISSSTAKMPALTAINDRLLPKDETDRSVPYTHWWPKNGTTEWLGYEFPEVTTVQSATVYWYDDGPWGGCRVPQSWRILYQDAQGNWNPVSGADQYPTDKGTACIVNFIPVKTKALRLEVVLPTDNSAGLFEWIVK
ncbi:MAG: glycoside hydrolase family 127 protein [Prevotella ruminicola]|uniref:Glycoside hydrolase family 127 protein n=1 Tax=Xylanibacter ruminicola TaxID=839 RepID=A0A9D5S7C4_XYLRU|nr:glycoside hydrolase family 127 protein [Xylanibacter ruminicola]